jgi:hypothetical protein
MTARIVSMYDADAMNAAADDWGSPNDPYREDFVSGWTHQRAGSLMKPDQTQVPAEINAKSAFLSGFIAARETPLVS